RPSHLTPSGSDPLSRFRERVGVRAVPDLRSCCPRTVAGWDVEGPSPPAPLPKPGEGRQRGDGSLGRVRHRSLHSRLVSSRHTREEPLMANITEIPVTTIEGAPASLGDYQGDVLLVVN